MAAAAVLAFAGLYGGDYLSARYRIPGNRQTLGSFQVHTFWAVRQKDGRIEYSLGDTYTQTCVRSLFPQLGYTPCWYLSRHTRQNIEVGMNAVSGPGRLAQRLDPRNPARRMPSCPTSFARHVRLTPCGTLIMRTMSGTPVTALVADAPPPRRPK